MNVSQYITVKTAMCHVLDIVLITHVTLIPEIVSMAVWMDFPGTNVA